MQDQDKNKLHDTAALRALSGEEIDAYVPENHGVHQAVDLDAHNDSPGQLAKPVPPRPRQVARPNFAHQRMRAHNMQFRKIAAPALFGVGLILWAIAGLTVWMKNSLSSEAATKNPLMANSNVFIWICILLGCVLIGGAVLFLVEVRSHNKSRA